MKILLLISVLFFYAFSHAQTPTQITYDPTNAANMGTQIENSTKQLDQMQKSAKQMKENSDLIKKVSNYVQTLAEIQEIGNNYKEALKYAKLIPKRVEDWKEIELKKEVKEILLHDIGKINSSILFLQKLINTGSFNMTDYDRIMLIREEYQKSKITLRKLKRLAQ